MPKTADLLRETWNPPHPSFASISQITGSVDHLVHIHFLLTLSEVFCETVPNYYLFLVAFVSNYYYFQFTGKKQKQKLW